MLDVLYLCLVDSSLLYICLVDFFFCFRPRRVPTRITLIRQEVCSPTTTRIHQIPPCLLDATSFLSLAGQSQVFPWVQKSHPAAEADWKPFEGHYFLSSDVEKSPSSF